MTATEPVLFPAREVPLGGLRAMSVLRSLPQRDLPTIGAWCFLDRFGPQQVTMRVDPHPHMGLQTVTWPLSGEIRHRDSLGSDVVLRPGALNLMTAGNGISHSEYSLGDGNEVLDALQLWIALPDPTRAGDRGFESHAELPVVDLGGDSRATVVMGTLAGVTSPATTFTPLVGADVVLAPGAQLSVPLNEAWEYAVVGLSGEFAAGPTLGPANGDLLYLGLGHGSLQLASAEGARFFLLGGEPLDEELVMWWNFVGRTHEDIAQAWDDWENRSGRFGTVDGHGDVRIPAPPLPTVRLLPRQRR